VCDSRLEVCDSRLEVCDSRVGVCDSRVTPLGQGWPGRGVVVIGLPRQTP